MKSEAKRKRINLLILLAAAFLLVQLVLIVWKKYNGMGKTDYSILTAMNAYVALLFFFSVRAKIRAVREEKTTTLAGLYLSFLIKFAGLILALVALYFLMGSAYVYHLRFFILGMFLFYMIVDYALVYFSIKKK